jgi:Family of unknown function (DUF6010)
MTDLPPLSAMNFIGPAIGAIIFVLFMSLVPEPQRHRFNAILVAGSAGVYISGGFGAWELLYAALATAVAYCGLSSYRFIALGWLMHACWDVPHHFWHKPIWPFMPTSSLGCASFDSIIAMWFLANAPALIKFASASPSELAVPRHL